MGAIIDLYQKIGLPCTLEDLGIADVTYEALMNAATRANEKTMARLTLHKFQPEEIARSILTAEKYVREYISRKL
jgi:glycerol dehydrogenase-like iron-containing ADH family enzyme